MEKKSFGLGIISAFLIMLAVGAGYAYTQGSASVVITQSGADTLMTVTAPETKFTNLVDNLIDVKTDRYLQYLHEHEGCESDDYLECDSLNKRKKYLEWHYYHQLRSDYENWASELVAQRAAGNATGDQFE